HTAAREIEESLMETGIELDITAERFDGQFSISYEIEDIAAGFAHRFELLRILQTLRREASGGSFQKAPQLNRIVNVFGGKALNDKTPCRANLQEALMGQAFQSEVERDAGDVQLGGQRHFADALAGAETALYQHLAQSQGRASRLGRGSGIGSSRHLLNLRLAAVPHAAPPLKRYFTAKTTDLDNMHAIAPRQW